MKDLLGILISSGLFYLISGFYFFFWDWLFKDLKGQTFAQYLILWPAILADQWIEHFNNLKKLLKRKE